MKKPARERRQERRQLFFKRMQLVMFLFLMLALALYLVQMGIAYKRSGEELELMKTDETGTEDENPSYSADPVCLLLWQDGPQDTAVRNIVQAVLDAMRVPYTAEKVETGRGYDFQKYETVVLALTDLTNMGEQVLRLTEWTAAGGKLMLACIPSANGYLNMIEGQLGVLNIGSQYMKLSAVQCVRPFMPGGEEEYPLTGAYQSAVQLQLKDGCEVYLASNDTYPVPLIWRWTEGSGTVVVMNLGYTEKSFRGFYAAAYSLLGDAFAWPVINGAAYFLDDFPSPLAFGSEDRLKQDFRMGYRDFLTQIWWPDMQELAGEYGLRYTGALTETYSDETEVPLPPNRELSRYQYFGRSLLDLDGEIGLHGYNHMPLVMDDFDYRGGFDGYVRWGSTDDMKSGLDELIRFGRELFPIETFSVYIPPSNVLSDQARALIAEEFPDIRAIAGGYLPGGVTYAQEFEVADDGIVELPRVVEGNTITDTDRLSALSELTLHFVSTYSQRPDEVLDENDTEDLGWSGLKAEFEGYLKWVSDAAPPLRELTASELAAAVQRYDALKISQKLTENVLTIEIDGLQDEAWMLVRLNGRGPGDVTGGTLEPIQEGLYLMKAEDSHVEIDLK